MAGRPIPSSCVPFVPAASLTGGTGNQQVYAPPPPPKRPLSFTLFVVVPEASPQRSSSTLLQTNRHLSFVATLRALYLSDNDFEVLPADIGKLTKLQIVSPPPI